MRTKDQQHHDQPTTQTESNTKPLKDKISLQIKASLNHIHQSYQRDISLNELAKIACMSRHHFNRTFKKSVGVPPIQYLNSYRLKQAQELLTKTNLPITQISLATGFNQPAYFTRKFTQELGVSPTQYRKKL